MAGELRHFAAYINQSYLYWDFFHRYSFKIGNSYGATYPFEVILLSIALVIVLMAVSFCDMGKHWHLLFSIELSFIISMERQISSENWSLFTRNLH